MLTHNNTQKRINVANIIFERKHVHTIFYCACSRAYIRQELLYNVSGNLYIFYASLDIVYIFAFVYIISMFGYVKRVRKGYK